MSDPITTIITAAIEHAPSAAAVASLYKVAKPFLAKVIGPASEEIGELGRDYIKGWRAKNGNQVLAGADTLLKDAGREPQQVPLKTLLPLLDAASLEDDAVLAAHWMALLANAADPAQRLQVQPAFIEVLRQLTPTDAQVLDYIYRNRPRLAVDNEVMPDKIMAVKLVADLGLPPADIGLSIDNLFRLWLCAKPNGLGGAISLNVNSTNYSLLPTILGQSFYDAVTPPTP